MMHEGRIRKMGGAALALLFAVALAASVGACKKKRPFAEACSEDLDCESLQCSQQGGICSKNCTYDAECGGDLVCRGTSDTGGQCSKALGQAPNGACMNGDDCSNGHCLHKVGEDATPGICSKWCQTGADCPDHMKLCAKISDSGLLKFCLPGDEKTPRPNYAPPKVVPKPVKGATKSTPPPPPVVAPSARPTAVVATATATASAKPTATPATPAKVVPAPAKKK